MAIPRRRFLHLVAGAAVLPAMSGTARTETYPTRPVRGIVPQAPGGAADISARLMGQWLSERLGQPFIIENRTGAGGNIGTEAVVTAPPDGYTFLVVGSFNAINATLYDKVNFNFIRDIAPVAGIMRNPLIMEVTPSFPAKSVAEFIAYAKANPGKLNMGSAGNGSPQHMSGELLKMMAAVDMGHVPLSRFGTYVDRPASRRAARRVRSYALVDRTRQGWQATCAGRDDGDALGGTAGYSIRGRVRAWVRVVWMDRRWRTPKHAGRRHREAQR